jgi:hypothetical protein
MHKEATGQVVETAREARGGYRDRPVLVVVTVGTALAFGGLLLLWAYMT